MSDGQANDNGSDEDTGRKQGCGWFIFVALAITVSASVLVSGDPGYGSSLLVKLMMIPVMFCAILSLIPLLLLFNVGESFAIIPFWRAAVASVLICVLVTALCLCIGIKTPIGCAVGDLAFFAMVTTTVVKKFIKR